MRSFLDWAYVNIILRATRITKEFIYKKRRKRIKADFEKRLASKGVSYGLAAEPREQKIIVSLTSFPPRYKTIMPCLKSLLMQTEKPDKIIVWLYQKDFPITDDMTALSQYGVEYRSVTEDLRPHKKYFYAMKEFPRDIIITVDDDVIYPENLIENLVRTHKKYPDCVVANRVHKIVKKHDGSLFSYNHWIHNYTGTEKPRFDLITTGVGGVLYPPACLDARCFDAELIKKHCLGADDIWLKTMELLRGTKVVWAKNKCPLPYIIEDSQEVALVGENVDQSKNDRYIEAMQKMFGKEKFKLTEMIKSSDEFLRIPDDTTQTNGGGY